MVATQVESRRKEAFAVARFVEHPSFHEKNAGVRYRASAEIPGGEAAASYLPDEATRELSKRMHYAAYRLQGARSQAEARTWRMQYLHLRDQILLGNRKLIYRAVHTRVRDPQLAEDCAADCHLVMIRAVACYNPWLGIRFSTYLFTCLLRELTRLVQKQTKDRLCQAASFDHVLFDAHFETESHDAEPEGSDANLSQFFATEHPLLSDREKHVLSQRFGLNSDGSSATLQDIGSDLKISKERVRQLQNSGLHKLREVIADDCVGV